MGQTVTTELTISVRNPTEFPVTGVQNLAIHDAPGIDIEPNDFTIDFTNATTATRTISVTKTSDVPLTGFHVYWLPGPLTLTDEHNSLIVDAPAATDFTFTAAPTTVAVASYLESEEVTFTLQSLNGYHGRVHVSVENSGIVGEVPATGNFDVDLAAGETRTFKRRFTRSEGAETGAVVYTAKDTVTNASRNVTITVKPNQ